MNVEELKTAVDEFFSDTSRSQEETRDALEQVQEQIEFMIESLR